MTVLYLFDLDETLFEHDPIEHANFPKMGNSEWVKYNSTELFMKGRPIKGMIKLFNLIKETAERYVGERVAIMTARDRMDDYNKFIEFLDDHHIYDTEVIFAGANYHSKGAPLNKYMSIAKLLKEYEYDVVHLFDDSKENIEYMLALKEDFPWVEFYGHHFHKVNTFGKWEH